MPQKVIDTWDEDNALNRATATVTANLDYLNFALANSDLPIRYVVWGDIQDIGATDEEIGRKSKTVVFNKYVSYSFSLDRLFSSSVDYIREFSTLIIILVFLLVLETPLRDIFECTRQPILYFCT